MNISNALDAANSVRKAIVAALGALGVWLGTAPADGITSGEWAALGSCLVVGLIAWLTPNERIEGDDGAVQWSTVALVLLAIVAVLWALGEAPR